jgi:hypothetical protein
MPDQRISSGERLFSEGKIRLFQSQFPANKKFKPAQQPQILQIRALFSPGPQKLHAIDSARCTLADIMKKIICAVLVAGAMSQIANAMGPMGDTTHRHLYKDQEWIWQKEENTQPKGEATTHATQNFAAIHFWSLPLAFGLPNKPPFTAFGLPNKPPMQSLAFGLPNKPPFIAFGLPNKPPMQSLAFGLPNKPPFMAFGLPNKPPGQFLAFGLPNKPPMSF